MQTTRTVSVANFLSDSRASTSTRASRKWFINSHVADPGKSCLVEPALRHSSRYFLITYTTPITAFIVITQPESETETDKNRTKAQTSREKFIKSDISHMQYDSNITRGQSNLTKSASRGANYPVRGHPRGSKVVPLNSWGWVSY